MDRAPGLSVRLKLTLSYAGFLMLAGALLLAVVWVFLLRYVPDAVDHRPAPSRPTAPTSCAPSLPAAAGAGLPAGVRSRRRVDSRRPHARPADSHHRRHTPGRERIALAPDPAGGPQRRVPRARRRLRHHARAARGARRRAAAIRSQRLPRAAHPAGDHADAARRGPQGSGRDTGELVDRLHAVNTRAIDLTEALLLLSRADQRSFTREHVDLSLIAEEATETLLPLAEKRGVTIETSGDVTPRPSARTRSCCR